MRGKGSHAGPVQVLHMHDGALSSSSDRTLLVVEIPTTDAVLHRLCYTVHRLDYAWKTFQVCLEQDVLLTLSRRASDGCPAGP